MKSHTLSAMFICLFTGFAALQPAQPITPPPDGAYPGGNTAEGQNALFSLTSGGYNTAVGFFSLRINTTNSFNTAVGAGTLLANTADENTAIGTGALLSNSTGSANTASGVFALANNTLGSGNTATGINALFSNTIGSDNVAVGLDALSHNIAGSSNIAIGDEALSGCTGNANIALGGGAGVSLTTGDNNIDIGNSGVPGESFTIRIGDDNQSSAFIAGIAGQTVGTGGTTCYVDNDGKLGVFLSARRFKTDIVDMGNASDVLLALRPVTFRYKPELDKTGTPQFGLVAEEVAKVNPALVTHNPQGELSTVRYEAINAMLLNEFLKEHKAFIEQQRKMQELQKQVEKLTAGLQEVSADLELKKREPQTVKSNY